MKDLLEGMDLLFQKAHGIYPELKALCLSVLGVKIIPKLLYIKLGVSFAKVVTGVNMNKLGL